MSIRLILCTCAPDQAEEIARTLVDERLVGCANLVPGVRSLYGWAGEIADDLETILLMETTPERLDEAMGRLRELHRYEVPKLLVLAPTEVNAAYEAWLGELVRRGG